jgi:hypothetical protein
VGILVPWGGIEPHQGIENGQARQAVKMRCTC